MRRRTVGLILIFVVAILRSAVRLQRAATT